MLEYGVGESVDSSIGLPQTEVRQRGERVERVGGIVVAFERVAGPVACLLNEADDRSAGHQVGTSLDHGLVGVVAVLEINQSSVARPRLIGRKKPADRVRHRVDDER